MSKSKYRDKQTNFYLDDPNSPSYTKEQPSEVDLWSDIEQTSSDHIQDDSIEHDEITTGDDDSRTVSTLFNADLESKKSTQSHSNAASLFWQYNVQAKGPKTKRILYLKERDPHLFREFTDPVYQIKLTQKKGQTLTKLRKGDGNDVTPNPMKLHQLGKQIRDLSSFVNKSHSNTPSVYREIYQVDQQANNNDTAEVKKEKNKIASRLVFFLIKVLLFCSLYSFTIYNLERVGFVRRHNMKQIN